MYTPYDILMRPREICLSRTFNTLQSDVCLTFDVAVKQYHPLGGCVEFSFLFRVDVSVADTNQHGDGRGGGDNVAAQTEVQGQSRRMDCSLCGHEPQSSVWMETSPPWF